jgi:hypothetical protein
VLDRSQSPNLFDSARPASAAGRENTQPLPRLQRPSPARPPRLRACLASPFQRQVCQRLAAVASTIRRQTRLLPAAIAVFVLLTHTDGCDRSSPATHASAAAVPRSRPTLPVVTVKATQPKAVHRAPRSQPVAPRGLPRRRARAIPRDAAAPDVAGRVASSAQPSPVASSAQASTPAPTYVPAAPAQPKTPTEPSPSRSEPNGEFGFEAQADHQ